MLHALGLVALLHAVLALMLHALSLVALLHAVLALVALAFLALVLGGLGSLLLAIGALLIGRLGAGLTVLVVLALMLLLVNHLGAVIAGGNVGTRGVLGQMTHLDAIRFFLSGVGSLSHHSHAGKSSNSESQ